MLVTATCASAETRRAWRLHMPSTGHSIASYESFDACMQAAATRSPGTYACKPDTTATSEPTTDPAAVTEVPAPPLSQPVATSPPLMHAGLPVDASTLPIGSPGYAVERVQPTSEAPLPTDNGAFRTTCDFSHMSFDDPIVYPGQPGAAHLHAFFGNTGTNANSTALSLQTTGNSTCRGGTANRSAYWVPAMIDMATGKPIAPDVGNFYYKQGHLPANGMRTMPPGLRIVAGDPTSAAPGVGGVRFSCVGGPNASNDQYGSAIPDCDAGAQVMQSIWFPQCWDGMNLDAPDHKSHMSYPIAEGVCPATHPVALPQIAFNIAYTVPVAGAARSWRLSSDVYDRSLPGGYSSHADWFNGWKPEISEAWGRGCVIAVKDCYSHLLGDGRMIY